MTEEEKVYKYLQKRRVDKLPLENEIFAIRDSRKKINDYTICVDGYISLDAINKNIDKLNLIEKLQKENKKKDNVINLMAEFIDNNLKDCLLNILKEKGYCEDTDRFKTCKDCIKQYFERKVSGADE